MFSKGLCYIFNLLFSASLVVGDIVYKLFDLSIEIFFIEITFEMPSLMVI